MSSPVLLAADQRPCFRYIESTRKPSTILIRNCKYLAIRIRYIAIFYGYTVQNVLDLIENPEDRFSSDQHIRTQNPEFLIIAFLKVTN